MFERLNMVKGFKVLDNMTNNEVEVVTFNATLREKGNLEMYMNINYPTLYNLHKDEILIAYREFCGDITALGSVVGLSALKGEIGNGQVSNLETLTEEFKVMATNVFKQVIEELPNVVVNSAPINNNRYM